MRSFLLLKRFAITSKNENNKEMMDIKERKSLVRKYAISTKAAPAKSRNCEEKEKIDRKLICSISFYSIFCNCKQK